MLKYILPQNEKNLKQFKYKSSQSGYSYDYLWSPFAQLMLRFTPLWLAPNLITFVAFLLVVVQHAVFMWDVSKFGQPLPGWKYVMMGVTILVYQTLDNMDGKQARRTKNSSPVGMLFDHGADAITAALFGMQIAMVLQIQNEDFVIFLMFYVVMYPNFVGLWKQYGTGIFDFDKINPIDEGLPTYATLAILSAIYDFSWFNEFHIYAKYNEEIMALVALGVSIVALRLQVDLIVKPPIRARQDILKKVLTPLILVASLLGWRFWLDPNIFNYHCLPILYILAFYWGRNLMYIQLCHVADQRFHSLNIGNVFYMVIWGISVVLYKTGTSREDMHTYFTGAAIFLCLVCLEFAVAFLGQARDIMGIRIFHINTPKAEKIKQN